MVKETSAGIIAYFKDKNNQYKFLVCKPGGPYFKNNFIYGFPKGHVENSEYIKQAALREFLEETGIDYIDYRKLNQEIITKTSSKNFHFFLYETDEIWNLKSLKSNLYLDEKLNQYFPENDDFQYMTFDELKTKTFKYLLNTIKQLEKILK